MGQILGHKFDGSCLVVKLLRGDAPVIIVQEVEDGRDKWRDFPGDRIAKGGEVFGVYIFNDFLCGGSFKQ